MKETNQNNNHIDELLFYLKENRWISLTKDSEEHVFQAKDKLRAYKLIEKYNEYSWRLTAEGYDAVELGGFENWKKAQKKESSKTHIENISLINGDGNALNQISKSKKSKPKNIVGESKSSYLEIASWITGIIAAIICVYQFLIK